MNNQKTAQPALEDIKVNVKLKLAILWTSLMFFIIYLDYFHLYMPGKIDEILKGKVFVYDVSQGFLMAALGIVGLPALMIFLSVALRPKLNRWVNISIAAINIPLILYNLAGEVWMHMIIGAIIEVMLLCFIIRYAWKWPRTNA